ncbi:MAG: hypothetical protein AAGH89_12845 [Verrucomicrobiota bacterium]
MPTLRESVMWKYVVAGIIVLIALCGLWPRPSQNLDVVDLTIAAIEAENTFDLIHLFDTPNQPSEAETSAFLKAVESGFGQVIYSPLATVTPDELAQVGFASPLEWFSVSVATLQQISESTPEGTMQITTSLQAVEGKRGLLVLYRAAKTKDLLAIELRTEPDEPHRLPEPDQ